MFSKKYCFRLSPWNIYTSQFLHIFTVSWTLYFFEQVLQKFQLSPLNFMYVEQNITLKQSLLRTSACFKWLTLHVKITCREKNVSSYTTFSFFFWGSFVFFSCFSCFYFLKKEKSDFSSADQVWEFFFFKTFFFFFLTGSLRDKKETLLIARSQSLLDQSVSEIKHVELGRHYGRRSWSFSLAKGSQELF